jgi:mRNA interferase RelE/StbE
MDRFEVVLTREAQDDLVALDETVRERILDKLEWLGTNARLIRHQSLQGKKWAGLFRYRVGDYRIFYQVIVTVQQVVVVKVGHRRDIYKR